MSTSTVNDVLRPNIEHITSDDSLRNAKRRMGNSALRSLIVVDENRPVGMITWPTVRDLDEENLDQPISTVMEQDLTVLRPDQSLQEAQSMMGHDINIDELPVVSDSGELIGAVGRETLVHESTPVSESPGVAGSGTDPTLVPVKQGMSVRDADGSKLGSVTEADFQADGAVETFTIEHGLIFKKHKRLPGDVIREIEGDDIHLRIGESEFDMINDLEDAEV